MNALTGAERTRNLRLRNKAADFSRAWLRGKTVATPDEFIEAQEKEVCYVQGFADVQLNAGVVNAFYNLLADRSLLELGLEPIEQDYLSVIDMIDAWGYAVTQRT